MARDGYPAPGGVRKGDHVGIGIVQHTGRGWYLVTSDGEGMYGNAQRRGGPGIGCGCPEPSPRVAGGNAVRYAIVGPIPERYEGTPATGYICGSCDRALVGRSPGGS